jgi:hypothetical protein
MVIGATVLHVGEIGQNPDDQKWRNNSKAF